MMKSEKQFKFNNIFRKIIDSKFLESYIRLDYDVLLREDIKCQISQIVTNLMLENLFKTYVTKKIRKFNIHTVFYGNSGTGKTLIANKLAKMYQTLFCLGHNKIIKVTREDFIGQHVGETALKTKEILKKAENGILLIDCPYDLSKDNNEKDYGKEAIELLLESMEDKNKNIGIFFLGEEKKMKKFFQLNQGLSSRIGNHLYFKDYNIEELAIIGLTILENEYHYIIGKEFKKFFKLYLSSIVKNYHFQNLHSVKDIIYKIICFHSRYLIFTSKESLKFQKILNLEDSCFLSYIFSQLSFEIMKE